MSGERQAYHRPQSPQYSPANRPHHSPLHLHHSTHSSYNSHPHPHQHHHHHHQQQLPPASPPTELPPITTALYQQRPNPKYYDPTSDHPDRAPSQGSTRYDASYPSMVCSLPSSSPIDTTSIHHQPAIVPELTLHLSRRATPILPPTLKLAHPKPTTTTHTTRLEPPRFRTTLPSSDLLPNAAPPLAWKPCRIHLPLPQPSPRWVAELRSLPHHTTQPGRR